MIQQVILGSFVTCWNIKITFSNVEGREGKNGSRLVSWLAPGCPYLDRAERRNTRSVTKGRARCEGKEENEKERLPFFLRSITPRYPLDRVSLWEPEKRPSGTSQPIAHTLLYYQITYLVVKFSSSHFDYFKALELRICYSVKSKETGSWFDDVALTTCRF